ncbi:MAG: hypothetical protein ACOYLX_17460 [Burkholderiaceae bacterium]
MAGGGTGKEVNFWPGFVDALANVVVTMIFVVVVFTIALLYFAQNKVKEALSSGQKVEQVPPTTPPPVMPSATIAELQRRVTELQRENEQLRRQAQTPATSSAPPQAGSIPRAEIRVAETAQQPGRAPALTRIQGAESSLEIVFPAGAIEMDAPSIARLEAAFAAFADRARSDGVELVAIAEAGPYSEGRRLGYYRNLTLRNWLIERGVPAARVRMRLADVDSGRPQGLVQLSPAAAR